MEDVLRNLVQVLKTPGMRFISTKVHVGKLRDGPTTPIVVAVEPFAEIDALLAQVSAAAISAGFKLQATCVTPPDSSGRWPLELAPADASPCVVWPAVAIYAIEKVEEPEYVSPYTQAAVAAAKAEFVETARDLAQAVLQRLTDSLKPLGWGKQSGVWVHFVKADEHPDMCFRPTFVMVHRHRRFGLALVAAVSEWARRFPGLVVTRADDGSVVRPLAAHASEAEFPPGVDHCNWMNVVIAAQEFPTRAANCSGKPYVFEDLAAVELDFAKLAFATMCAVSK